MDKCSPILSAIMAKRMHFGLIRGYRGAHGKSTPSFNFWSLWLSGLSLAGWGSALQGPSHGAMLPKVTRASRFSDRVCAFVCACVSVCQVQYSLHPVGTVFSGWHAAGLLKIQFQNIYKFEWSQIFEKSDMKDALPSRSQSLKAEWVPAGLVKRTIKTTIP